MLTKQNFRNFDACRSSTNSSQLQLPPHAHHNTLATMALTDMQRSILICIFYGSCSMSLSFVNKVRKLKPQQAAKQPPTKHALTPHQLIGQAVLSRYGFKCTFFLLSIQLCVSLSVCMIVKMIPEDKRPFTVPTFDWATYKK